MVVLPELSCFYLACEFGFIVLLLVSCGDHNDIVIFSYCYENCFCHCAHLFVLIGVDFIDGVTIVVWLAGGVLTVVVERRRWFVYWNCSLDRIWASRVLVCVRI